MRTTYFVSIYTNNKTPAAEVEGLVADMLASVNTIFESEANISAFTKGKATSSNTEGHIRMVEGVVTCELLIDLEGEARCTLDKGKLSSLFKSAVGRTDLKFEKKCVEGAKGEELMLEKKCVDNVSDVVV